MNPKVKLYLIVWVPWAIMVSIVSYLIYFNFSYEALAKLLSVKGSYNETVLSPSVYMNFSDDPPINSSLVELIGGREFETMEMPEEDFNLPPGIAAGFISGQMAGQRAPAPDAPNAGWVTDAETAGTNRGSNSSGTVPMPGLVAPVTPHSGAQIERTASSAKFESQEKMEDNVHMPKLVNPFGPLQNFGHKFSFPTNKENSSTTKPTVLLDPSRNPPRVSNRLECMARILKNRKFSTPTPTAFPTTTTPPTTAQSHQFIAQLLRYYPTTRTPRPCQRRTTPVTNDAISALVTNPAGPTTTDVPHWRREFPLRR